MAVSSNGFQYGWKMFSQTFVYFSETCSHILVDNTLTQDMNLLLQLSVYSEMGYKCSNGYIQIVQHLGGYILCIYVLLR